MKTKIKFTLRAIALMAFAVSLSTPAGAQQSEWQIIENIPYRDSNDRNDPYIVERCVLDIYHPGGNLNDPDNLENPSATLPRPVVVWFHGGGLTGGAKEIPGPLKNSGLVVVAANYRLLPRATIGECIDDAAAAVAWVFREIGRFGGDPSRVFVSGHSAGGYLANMIGLDRKWLAAHGANADDIAALIPLSGQAVTHYAVREMLGIAPTQATIDQWAPLFWVRADAPPLVIVSGDREMELYGRYEETAYLWRMMRLAGHTENYLYELDGHDHGTMVEPGLRILKNHKKNRKKFGS